MANTPQKTPALPGFKRLNHKTYLYDPSESSDGTASSRQDTRDSPALIVLASWMNANLRHVSKFATYYQMLYPSSPILLLTSATGDFFFNGKKRQKKELGPAVATIRNYVLQPSQGLLVHTMSNGGGGSLVLLAEQYRNVTGQPLPAQAIVYDSVPGQSRFKQGLRAMSQGLPKAPYIRWPMQALLAMLLFLFFHLPRLFGGKTLATTMRENLNSVEPEFVRKEAIRCYIYSDVDEFILEEDIEEHAAEAESKGLRVDKAMFKGSPHVGHMRVDPERYWELVYKTWMRRA